MHAIKNIVIFYFSGTGNAKRIALWIYESAISRDLNCRILNIAKCSDSTAKEIAPDELIIFISPIHGFNYPKITIDFIRHFPTGNNKVILMNTRAGMKIGKWVTPGLTGIAFFLTSFILKRKGYKIVGQIPYDMPSNWISLHPALNDRAVKYIHAANYKRVQKHFHQFIAGKTLFISHRDIVQDILISPVSLLYYFIGRFIIAKTFYASGNCDNCGLCIKQCPVSAITEINNRPFWTVHCESCMRCMNYCPRKAIETSHGLLAITIILYSIIIGLVYIFLPNLQQPLIKFILGNLVFFSTLVLLYKLQHLLLKIDFLAKIIAYTSLTYYQFWGRYKSIPDKVWQQKSERIEM